MGRKSEHLNDYKSIFSELKIGIWEYNLDKKEFTWDDNSRLLHGLPEGQYISNFQNWVSMVHEQDRSELLSFFEKLSNDEKVTDITFRIKINTEGFRKLNFKAYKKKSSKGPILVGLLSETYGNSEMLPNKMTIHLAHEVNNPLLIIQGKAILLKKRVQQNDIDIECCKRDLDSIQINCERIDKVIKSLNRE